MSRTWSPQRGIVFGMSQARGTYRGLSTAAAGEIREDHLLHSTAEDSYVLAGTITTEEASMDVSSAPVEGEAIKNTPEVSAENADAAESISTLEVKSYEETPEQNELPETPTSFKMTEELFRAAKNAEPGTPASYWSHTLYRGPEEPGKQPRKPTVHYCRSIATTERVLKAYFMDQKVIGFDIEWRAEGQGQGYERYIKNKGPRQNVSLVQIACEDRIALFHIALYTPKGDEIENLVSPTLKKILEDPNVTKVGVAIKADCTRVKTWLGIDARGMFELSHLSQLICHSKTKEFSKINKKLIGLAKQVQEHLHLPLSKDSYVRSSDWSKTLDLQQISYAAADSYAGFQLFHTMDLKRKTLDPIPPLPYHVELNRPIRVTKGAEILADGEAEEVEGGQEEIVAPRTKRKYTKKSEKGLAVEKESIEVEDTELDSDADYVPSSQSSIEDTSSSTIGTVSTIITRRARQKSSVLSIHDRLPSSPFLSTTSQASLLEIATARATSHYTSLPSHHSSKVSSPTPQDLRNLRAFFLWDKNPTLSLLEIGTILRDPHPLPLPAVASSVLRALQSQEITCDPERMRQLLKAYRRASGLENAPAGSGKFADLEKSCGFMVEAEKEEEEA